MLIPKCCKGCANKKWGVCNCILPSTCNEYVEDESVTNKQFIALPRTKQILLVEDGSIDIDEAEEKLQGTGMEIITYREGAQKPELINLGDN